MPSVMERMLARKKEKKEQLRRFACAERCTEVGEGVLTSGSSKSPVVLFLHAAACTRKAFVPQLDALSDEFHCISIDAAGHGELASGPIWSMEESVARVLAALAAASAEQVVIVGLSLGGYTAMEIARRQPRMVVGLLLSGCTFDFTGNCGALKQDSVADDYEAKMLKGRVNLEDGGDLDGQDYKDAVWEACITAPGTTPLSMVHAFRDWDLNCGLYHSGVERCACPVLVLVPESETSGPLHNQGNAEALAARAAGPSSVVVMPKAGHLLNVENPAAYSEKGRLFARECHAAPPPTEETLARLAASAQDAPPPDGSALQTPAGPPPAAAPAAGIALAGMAPTATAAAPAASPATAPAGRGVSAARIAELQAEYFADDISPPAEAYTSWTDEQAVAYFEHGGCEG